MINIPDFIKNKLPYFPNWINQLLLRMNVLGPYAYGLSYIKGINKQSVDNYDNRLLSIVNYAIKNVPYYRKRYSGLVINSIDDFEKKIGFVDKDEILNNWHDFISDKSNPDNCIIASTGGTSGKPLKMLMPKNRYVNELINLHRHYFMFGWKYDLCAVLRNHHLENDRKYIINPIMKQVIFDPFKLDFEYAKYIWKLMKKFNVYYIHAYPSNAYQFLKMCYRQNLDLSFIKACFLSSEPVLPFQKHLFSDILRIPYFSFYGHSEKLIFAGNTPSEPENFEVNRNYGYLELINNGEVVKEVGTIGEMVGTTFYNFDFPLIRYRTNDFSHYEVYEHNSHLLGYIEGRWINTLIYRKDGTYVPLSSVNIHGDFNEHIDGIQYVQKQFGELDVLIIKNKYYSIQDEIFIINHLSQIFDGDSNSVKLKYVDRLIINNNGKFLPLISSLNGNSQ